MIIIKFFPNSSCGCDLPNYGKDFIITTGNNYTHAILLLPEKIRPNLTINKKNVVAIAAECPKYFTASWNLNTTLENFLEYCDKYIGKFLIGGIKDTNLPNREPFLSYHLTHTSGKIPKQIFFEKTKKMSIVISHKSFEKVWCGKGFGYTLRKELVLNILKRNFPIDIWGNGCEKLNSTDSRIKGSFNDSFSPYKNYQFTIAIENMKYPHYITEKFFNPINHKTIPIYWGAKYIELWYPNSCIQLCGNINTDMLLIKDILINSNKYLKDMDMAQKRYHEDNNLVKKCVNIWKN